MTAIPVSLGPRRYDVRIQPGLLDHVGGLTRAVAAARSAFIVTDSHVGPLYASRVRASLLSAGYEVSLAGFPAGEPHKTLATLGALFDQVFAASPPPDRDSVVVALGGGVTGDLAGLLAATLLRGVRFVQVPTTLLADVDSSVGGKTGVDHPAGKNLIGAFHQPVGVFIDPGTLATLPSVELASGLAECVKHAVIRDAELLDWIETHAPALQAGDPACLGELIARNVRIKAAVVAADERESGERAHLNFGHTIGHAIEAVAGFQADPAHSLRHGHCVALGMAAANAIAVARGQLPHADAARVEALLARLDLPTRYANLDPGQLLPIMRRDKKARAGKLRFVLPVRLGTVEVVDDVTDAEVVAALDYLARPTT